MNVTITSMALALLVAAFSIQAQPTVSLSGTTGEVWTKIQQKPSEGRLTPAAATGDFVDPSVTEATLLFAVCPNNAADFSSVWLPYRSSGMDYWATGTPQTNRVSLARFYAITAGDWTYLAVNPSATVPMELGVLSPPSNPQRGNRICTPFKLVGGPLTLAGIGLTISDGGSLDYALIVTGYSQEYIGHTSQGNAIAGGAATQTSYGLETTGPAVGFGASTQADLDQIRDWVGAHNSATAPYTLTCTLDATNTSGVWIVHLTRRLTFLATAATVYISQDGVVIEGVNEQMYQLEGTEALTGENAADSIWTPIGPPTVSGAFMPKPSAPSIMFYRGRQGQQ